jgi:multidrug resistance efflux pump
MNENAQESPRFQRVQKGTNTNYTPIGHRLSGLVAEARKRLSLTEAVLAEMEEEVEELRAEVDAAEAALNAYRLRMQGCTTKSRGERTITISGEFE